MFRLMFARQLPFVGLRTLESGMGAEYTAPRAKAI